ETTETYTTITDDDPNPTTESTPPTTVETSDSVTTPVITTVTSSTQLLNDGDLLIPNPRHIGEPARVMAFDLNLSGTDTATLKDATIEITMTGAATSGRRLWAMTDLGNNLSTYWANITHENYTSGDSPNIRSVDFTGATSATIVIPFSMLYNGSSFATKLYIVGTTRFSAPGTNDTYYPPEAVPGTSSIWRTDVTDSITVVNFKINEGTPEVTTTAGPTIPTPEGYDIFNMQDNPYLSVLAISDESNSGGTGGGGSSNSDALAALPFVSRASGGTTREVAVKTTSPQTITITGRSGSLQMVQFNLNSFTPRANHEYNFHVSGTCGTGSSSNLMLLRNGEASSSPELIRSTIGSGGAFNINLTRKATELVSTAVYSLATANSEGASGNTSSTVVITGMKITEICPENCPTCVAHTITFDANGGSVTPTSAKTHPNTGLLAELPTPTRSSNLFIGWFTTQTSGGVEVDKDYKFTSSITLYARWINPTTDFANLTAQQVVNDIKTGWNLGNTFDAHTSGSAGYAYNSSISGLEVVWLGNDTSNRPTKALIDGIYAQGFDSIRIPITWYKVIQNTTTYKIRDDWMARIKEVVDMAHSKGMYVIINTHHDESIMGLAATKRTTAKTAVRELWKQIADTFKNYDYKLIFEGINEPRDQSYMGLFEPSINGKEAEGGNSAYTAAQVQEWFESVNQLNQEFVTTVRNSGGNNAHRILMVPTYAANTGRAALDGFRVPNDIPANMHANPAPGGKGTVSKKIALSAHIYHPTGFTLQCTTAEWDEAGIRGALMRIYNRVNLGNSRGNVPSSSGDNNDPLDALGIPVILGEWGVTNNKLISSSMTERINERSRYANTYMRVATDLGFRTLWWDNGKDPYNDGDGKESNGLFKRSDGALPSNDFKQIINAIMQGRKGDPTWTK
ncbi:MAG: cellulase family glycosylhydrolase, partial [Oscillospiraceae bacterium]|nr:cellulase family glycosylhydrolase [Oscillospiraceae bacterium]